MQTFLPYADFKESAKVLDRQRLGKQRVETMQLLKALYAEEGGWRNHPACLMWRGFEDILVVYGLDICDEWTSRGYKDTCREKILDWYCDVAAEGETYARRCLERRLVPWWLGDEDFHASHRSNLLRKDPEHYGQFGWTEPPTRPYIWPLLLTPDEFRGGDAVLIEAEQGAPEATLLVAEPVERQTTLTGIVEVWGSIDGKQSWVPFDGQGRFEVKR